MKPSAHSLQGRWTRNLQSAPGVDMHFPERSDPQIAEAWKRRIRIYDASLQASQRVTIGLVSGAMVLAAFTFVAPASVADMTLLRELALIVAVLALCGFKASEISLRRFLLRCPQCGTPAKRMGVAHQGGAANAKECDRCFAQLQPGPSKSSSETATLH